MDINILYLSILWGIAAACLGWYIVLITQQITYVTLADGRKQERKLPLIFLLFIPLTPNFTPLFTRSTFDKPREKISIKLTAAGFEGLLSSEEFLSLRAILPICLGALWCAFIIICGRASPNSFIEKNQLIFCLLGPLWFSYYPSVWLKKALAIRHRSIQRSLPFTLDLLTLSVEAGLDFMTSLQRFTERTKIDSLAEELIRVVREIQIGKTRREALRNMAERVNLPELKSVVNALIQADELGVSIGSILRIQSDQIRQRRFERAEKLANEAPVKMLAPLILFIFPAVFLILLGPIIMKFLHEM